MTKCKPIESKPSLLFQLKFKNFAYDVHMTKICFLVYWVSDHIGAAPGKFISTHDLYNFYKKDITKIDSVAILEELTFYKEIQQALLANSIIVAKAREKGIRGLKGIKYSQ